MGIGYIYFPIKDFLDEKGFFYDEHINILLTLLSINFNNNNKIKAHEKKLSNQIIINNSKKKKKKSSCH